jgi:hypothetical protein
VIDEWVMKLEKANKPRFLNSKLYAEIIRNVENAMLYDYNLIIEEFEFYQQLRPRMQTELIDTIFIDFIEKFWPFFKHCKLGFRNEFIISMLVRLFKTNETVISYGERVRYIYFLQEGCTTLYDLQKRRVL